MWLLMRRILLLLIIFVVRIEGGSSPTIRVMTYNVWNFENGEDWSSRRKSEIASLIGQSEVDFVAFQEIRKSRSLGDMMEDLKAELPSKFRYYGYATGEKYETSEEGLGFVSSLPVLSQETKELTLGTGSDSNHRVCIRVTVGLPNGGELTLYLAHFSYDRKQQMSNAKEIKEFALKTSDAPRIILGDLNIYNDYIDPIKELSRYQNGRILFQDVWKVWDPYARDDRKGFTFPSWRPRNRADRILMNGPGISLSKAEVLGHAKDKKSASSDHLALVATFELPSSSSRTFSSESSSSSQSSKSEGTSALSVFFIILGVLLTFTAFIAVTHPRNRGKVKIFVSKLFGRDNAMALPTMSPGKIA